MVSLRVAGDSSSIVVGGKQQFIALAKYSDGKNIDVTKNVMWFSSNTDTATINSSGLATGISGGTTDIIASNNGMTSKFSLTVVSRILMAPTLIPSLTPAQNPTPVTRATAVPWFIIGGCAFACITGLTSFVVIRSRRGKNNEKGPDFVMIRSHSGIDGGTGAETWYILSEGRVIKIRSGGE